ncbi:MAG: hypothetical protein AB1696_25390 [Planctomycetota bacterium]
MTPDIYTNMRNHAAKVAAQRLGRKLTEAERRVLDRPAGLMALESIIDTFTYGNKEEIEEFFANAKDEE